MMNVTRREFSASVAAASSACLFASPYGAQANDVTFGESSTVLTLVPASRTRWAVEEGRPCWRSFYIPEENQSIIWRSEDGRDRYTITVDGVWLEIVVDPEDEDLLGEMMLDYVGVLHAERHKVGAVKHKIVGDVGVLGFDLGAPLFAADDYFDLGLGNRCETTIQGNPLASEWEGKLRPVTHLTLMVRPLQVRVV